MNKRQSMRPITIRRVVEVCRIVKDARVPIIKIMEFLRVGKRRLQEVVSELQVMNLIDVYGDKCGPNPNTRFFLENFEDEKWSNIHSYFYSNYIFYRNFVDLIAGYSDSDLGLSVNLLQEEAKRKKLSLNRASIEVLTDWCERLGIVQRHLYSGRVYLLKVGEPDLIEFMNKLVECFNLMTNSRRSKEVFIEIPRLREDVCERCKMTRRAFDLRLQDLYFKNVGRIELCGAPITTMAKKSPLSVKEIKPWSKEDVLAPAFFLRKEREGLVFRNKSYFYIAIHGALIH